MSAATPPADSDTRRLARNAAWSLLGFAIPSLVMLVAIPVYIGYLGLRDYGLFALASSLVSLAVILNLGLGHATTKYVAEYVERGEGGALRPMVYAALLFLFAIGAVATLLLALFSTPLVERALDLEGAEAARAARVIQIAAAGLIPHVSLIVAGALFNGLQQYRASQLLAIGRSIASLVAGVAALELGLGLEGMTAGIAAVSWITCAVGFGIGIRRLPPSDRDLRSGGTLLRRVAGFSFYTGLTSIGAVMAGHLDKLLLGSLLGLEAVSVYAVAQSAAGKIGVLTSAASRVLMPFFSARSVSPDTSGRMRETFVAAWRASLLIAAALATLALAVAPWALELWLEDRLAVAVLPVFAVFVVGSGLGSIAMVPYFYLLGRDRPSAVAWPTLAGGVAMLGGIAALAPAAGLIGAALASLLAPLIGTWMCVSAARMTPAYTSSTGIRRGNLGLVAAHALAGAAGFATGVSLERYSNQPTAALLGSAAVCLAILVLAALDGRRRGNPLWATGFEIARRVLSRPALDRGSGSRGGP